MESGGTQGPTEPLKEMQCRVQIMYRKTKLYVKNIKDCQLILSDINCADFDSVDLEKWFKMELEGKNITTAGKINDDDDKF